MAISRGIASVADRLVAREEVRVGATVGLIEAEAHERAERGEEPRDDGFFDDRGALRPEAEDLLEGILREAAASYEEQKVALLARLFTETAHDAKVKAPDSMLMIRLLRDLTYRQLLILATFSTHDPKQAQTVARLKDPLALDDLGERGLLAIETESGLRSPGRIGRATTYNELQSLPERLSDADEGVKLTPLGRRFVALTGARETVPLAEQAAWFVG